MATSLDKSRAARQKLLAQLAGMEEGWIAASLVVTRRTQGGKQRPFRYLSRSVRGKNQVTYVAAAQTAAFRQAVARGRWARATLETISELTIAIIKTQAKEGGRKG
jgi:hypothetical protein